MRFDLSKVPLLLATCLTLAVSLAPMSVLAQTPAWQPGPDGILDNAYDGFIDVPTNGATVPASGPFSVTGWVVDTTAQGWAGIDNVQVFLGAIENGKMIAQASIGQGRPDVSSALGNPYWAASGFAANVQGSDVPSGAQTLSVYAHTPGKGWWFKQVSVTGGGTAASAPAPAAPSAPAALSPGGPPTVSVDSPGENDKVSTGDKNSTFTIKGSANDPTYGPTSIDYVDVWLNGERDGRGGTELGQVTPGEDGKWQVQFKPSKFGAQHSNLYIYSHSSKTGLTTEIVRGFNLTT